MRIASSLPPTRIVPRRRGRRLGRSVAALAVLVLACSGCATIRAARLLRDAQRPAAELAGRTDERTERAGDVEVLAFAPRGETGPLPGLLLVHGAVGAGAREPRLVALARALAVHGYFVAAPDLVALKSFRADPQDPDRVAAVAGWLAGRPEVAGDRVALAGISIGGSYCLVAAARPELAERVSAVLAFGAYRDLEGLLASWMTEPEPSAPGLYDPLVEGRRRVFLGNVDELVPAPDAARVRRSLEVLVSGESLTGDPEISTEAGRRLLACALSTDPIDPKTAALVLAPVADGLRDLSPGADGRAPAARVFLLHGEDDPIVPPSESRDLAVALRDLGADVRVHVTGAFGHVDAREQRSLVRTWQLLRFVAGFLRAAGS